MLDAEFYRGQCARLRKENEELLAELDLAQEKLEHYETRRSKGAELARALRIPKTMGHVLAVLIENAPRIVNTYDLLPPGSRARLGDRSKIMAVYISKLRKVLRLKGFDGKVENLWGVGYSLDAQTAHTILTKFNDSSAETRMVLKPVGFKNEPNTIDSCAKECA